MTRGFLFLAKGEEFIEDATESARRINTLMPDIPISIVTDEQICVPCFDNVIVDESDFKLQDKPTALQATPYEKTIYIDSDTYVNEDISEVFDTLDQFEMALVRDHIEYNIRKLSETHPIEGVPEGFPEFNSGLIAYRNNPAVSDLFEDWKERIRPEHEYDQRTFRPVVYESSVRFVCLPARYNCLYMLNGCVTGDVKVFHSASGDLEKSIGVQEAIQKFGVSDLSRVFTTYEDTIFVDISPPIYLKLWVTLRDKGIGETIKKILNKAL